MHTLPHVILVRKEDKTPICLCGDVLNKDDIVDFRGLEYAVKEVLSNSEDWDSIASEIPLIQIAIAAEVSERAS